MYVKVFDGSGWVEIASGDSIEIYNGELIIGDTRIPLTRELIMKNVMNLVDSICDNCNRCFECEICQECNIKCNNDSCRDRE